MKILFTVEFFYPSVGGTQEVVKQISTGLAKRGHDVTIATTKLKTRRDKYFNGVKIEEFSITGNSVKGIKGEKEKYKDYLLHNQFDLMINYAAQQWATDLVFPLLNSIHYKKVFIPCGFSKLFTPAYKDYYDDIPSKLSLYDRLIFHSNNYRDINFARDHGFQNIIVIPNGASSLEFSGDKRYFREKYRIEQNTPVLLTVGNHTWMKGHQFVIRVFQQLKLKKGILIIIGKALNFKGCLPLCLLESYWSNISSKNNKRILVLNPPRDEVVQAYYSADLFLFASKIEYAPLVLLESMASKTPFITLATGNAEEIIADSKSGILAPTSQDNLGYSYGDIKSFSQITQELLMDKETRIKMGEAGYLAWQNKYTWENIVVQYENEFEKILNSK